MAALACEFLTLGELPVPVERPLWREIVVKHGVELTERRHGRALQQQRLPAPERVRERRPELLEAARVQGAAAAVALAAALGGWR